MTLPLLEQLHRDGVLAKGVWEEHQANRPPPDEASDGQGESPGRGPVPHLELLRLNHRGWLQGSLSVALDVRADELVGSLCAAMGGGARKLKVLDVRELGRGELELTVMLGQLEERWGLEDLYALVQNLNDLLRNDSQAKAVVILGEWEDMLQLWCVEKAELPKLFGRRYFAPRNHHQLRSLFAKRR